MSDVVSKGKGEVEAGKRRSKGQIGAARRQRYYIDKHHRHSYHTTTATTTAKMPTAVPMLKFLGTISLGLLTVCQPSAPATATPN